jgi:hypothetical protein
MRYLKQYEWFILALIFWGTVSCGLSDQEPSDTFLLFSSVTRQGNDIVATLDQNSGYYFLDGVPGQHDAGPGTSIIIKSNSKITLSCHMFSFVVSITTRHNHLGLLIINTYRTSPMSEEYHVEKKFIRAK